MDGRDLLPAEIATALEQGATVVTGNRRAARTLLLEFDRRNHKLGVGSWQRPMILDWDSWTATLWREALLEGHTNMFLLSPMQEHRIWRGVLKQDEELASLRTLDSLAEMAAEAWNLLWSYEGKAGVLRMAMSTDTQAFQRWAQMFERTCRSQNLLSRAQLERTLQTTVASGRSFAHTNRILLVGFDAMTPAQQSLLGAIDQAGGTVDELKAAAPEQQRKLVGTRDEFEELSVAARWLQDFIKERTEARVAVIVPDLETQRCEIDRVFREVLAPELEDIQVHGATGPYEFSLGVALAQMPLVAVAMELLRWLIEPLPMERVSALLLSPYFCMKAEERGARAEFDAFELRRARMLRPEVSLTQMSEMIFQSKRRPSMDRLQDALRLMRRTTVSGLNQDHQRSRVEWIAKMQEFLESAGWGVGQSEDSVEFQVRRRWESALDELATLDFDGIPVSFVDALDELIQIVQKTVFAVESREAPIQIMGPLEAAGQRFDAVWFLGCGDLNWPMATMGSPLLPWPIKRELGMPGSDVARDTQIALRMSERIVESAATVIFSYARESLDGKQRPSPLLRSLAFDEIEVAELVPPAESRGIVMLEETEDMAKLPPLPDRVIQGGARILELQAACGFRAFAEQRLRSSGIDPVEFGMDAREGGTVVHRILEAFWDMVKTQSALKAMSIQDRSDLLNDCIGNALRKTAQRSESAWDNAYVELQYERLQRLLGPWLELELARSPFAVKLSEKEFEDVRVGPLRLSVRMDRVDTVEGGEVLIDYKTGAASPNDWLTDRPTAPQLPLYAILSDVGHLQGVAFGLVRSGEGKELVGYGTHEDVLPKLARLKTPSLDAQVEDWRRILVALAEEFASGEARVAPNRYPTTCEHCGQRLLCRLNVSLLEDDEEDSGSVTELNRD